MPEITNNIFREAKHLLEKKDSGAQLTDEELELIATALIPLNLHSCPFPEEAAINEDLEELAKMVDGKER